MTEEPLANVPPQGREQEETVLSALQETVSPPLLPLQFQLQGPEPETALAVPELHKLAVGAVAKEEPLAEPQAPLIKGHIGGGGVDER